MIQHKPISVFAGADIGWLEAKHHFTIGAHGNPAPSPGRQPLRPQRRRDRWAIRYSAASSRRCRVHQLCARGRGHPRQEELPVWLGVGGTTQSFVRAGTLGLPLMVAIIGGEFRRFRPLVDLYREAGRRAGHPPARLKVGVHAISFVGATSSEAKDAFLPGWQYMFTEIGRERGWSPPTRAQFEAMCGPSGALLIGDPPTVAAKMLAASEALGGVSRITFQMSSASLEHGAMKRSIELVGAEVAPIVRRATALPPSTADQETAHG
jgi:hypothetical protein